jgi:hypothetical protein
MAHSKSEIVTEVLRANYGHCFYYLPKSAAASGTNYLPPPRAAQRTPFERVTCVVSDVSIIMNMFRMGAHEPSGRELVDFLLGEVKRAFEHANIHTYVMAADMSCFGVEAKEVLQRQRLEQAQSRAAQERVPLVPWDVDAPFQLVHMDRKLPSLTAMQASPGVLRQVLYEAMSLIPVRYTPPAGKRLILHMEPRAYTAPGLPQDFMPNDPSTGIVICEDRRDVVEASRRELTELWEKVPTKEWRRMARERTTELAKAGCFQTIPLCIETSMLGVIYEPFRLANMRVQAGEGDLSIQRYVPYLYTGAIVDRLLGDRRPRGFEANAEFYTAEQLAGSAQKLAVPGKYEFYVGEGGRGQVQCAAIVSVDSDFCGLLTFTLAMLVGNLTSDVADRFALIAPHAPLLVRGSVLTKSRETLRRGERRRYFPDGAEKAQPLAYSYELFDPALMYAELVRTGPAGASPLGVVQADADRRLAATTEKRRTNAEAKKRAISAGETPTPPAKRAKLASGAAKASVQSTQEEDDEDELGPVIHLPPVPAGSSVDFCFERVASWVMFTCMCGNDYLGGIPGVPRRWAYAAYAELLHNDPGAHLVRVVRHPADAKTRAPTLPAYVDCEVHERVLKYAYHMNLTAQACKTNKPAHPPAALTYRAVAELVAAKFAQVNKQPPDDERRQRMWMRLFWVYRYFACGTTNIRNIIDPLVWGWEAHWRHIVV